MHSAVVSLVRSFFEVNTVLVYFCYGLVFFVLGLAVALQTRQASHLDLSRSLAWLAAFGFTHAFHEWGDLFIPIQAGYLSVSSIRFLQHVHLISLGVSFEFLIFFGVALLRPRDRPLWAKSLAALPFVVWFVIEYVLFSRIYPEFSTWLAAGDGLARYMIGFPASLFAAYALRRHALDRIAPLNVPRIVSTLRVAGIMLATYAVAAGLIVPPTPYFPGTVLNTSSFEALFVVPAPVIRGLIGLALAIAVILGLEVFEVETARRLEAMEQQQILSAERLRIARDLHDGSIQKVYTAGLILQSAVGRAKQENEQLLQGLQRALGLLHEAIQDLRRSLGDLQARPAAEPLAESLSTLASDPRYESFVDVSLDIEDGAGAELSPERSAHLLAIANEALSNIVRHAKAKHATMSMQRQADQLVFIVRDDGDGIPESAHHGYGLRNMRDRARLLGGRLQVERGSPRGTVVRLTFPSREDR
jgi:signal transduction histidine kinase